jgi:putative flippase GtrA
VNQLLLRFLLVGLLNTGFGYAAFAGLTLLGSAPLAALVGATLAGMAFNFQTLGRLVFRTNGRVWRFIMVYAAVLDVNWLGLWALREVGVGALAAQAVLVLPMAGLSFAGQRWLVFSGGGKGR